MNEPDSHCLAHQEVQKESKMNLVKVLRVSSLPVVLASIGALT